MAKLAPNRWSGAAAESVHRITTKENSVTIALSRPTLIDSVRSEHVDVLGNALVGIVGGIAEELHAVVVGAGKPAIEVMLRHPAPPPDLQPLIEIELVDREHDVG